MARRIGRALLLSSIAIASAAAAAEDARMGGVARARPRANGGEFTATLSPDTVIVDEKTGHASFLVKLEGCTHPQGNFNLFVGYIYFGAADEDDVPFDADNGVVLGQSASSAQLSIAITNDALTEDNEDFFVALGNPFPNQLQCAEGLRTFACADLAPPFDQVSDAFCVAATVSKLIIVDDDPAPAPSCQGTAVLGCGAPVDVGNNGEAGTSAFSSYPCLVSPYPGRDVRYSFTAPEDGVYGVTLAGASGDLTADLDLVVVRGTQGKCGASGCVAASDSSGPAGESLSFAAGAGEQFLIVVDARTAATGSFRIELDCPAEPAAAFQVAPEFPVAGQQVQFFDRSQGSPIQFGWDFDDGGFAVSKNPRKTFQSPGAYMVTFNAFNDSGSDSTSRQVIVASPNAAIGVGGPGSGQVGVTLGFQGSAAGCQPDPSGWRWLTAGGEIVGPSTQSAVSIRWPSSGAKKVSASNRACGSALGTRTVAIARGGVVLNPATPTGLHAVSATSTNVVVEWNDTSSNEDGFRVERLVQGHFEEIGRAPANGTSLDVSLAGSAFPTTTPTTLRVRSFNAAGDSPGASSANVTTAPESCDSDLNLCLLGKRFRVEATWVARNFGPGEGVGHPVALTEDTGYFWFFNPENVELVVKVLDGRAFSNPPSYWVFFGALTNVEFTLRVIDTETGNVREYFNPPGQFASRGDTGALPSEVLAAALRGRLDRRPALEDAAAAFAGELVERALAVDFSYTPDVGRLTTDTLFEDLTQPESAFRARSWSFGDGTLLAAADAFTRYRYAEPGSYDVTLQLIDLFGDFFGPPDALTRKVEITPPPLPALQVRGPEEAAVGEQVTYSVAADQSCSPAFRGWQWDADGGTIVGRSNRPTVEVVWDDDGAKRLRVGNSRCGDVQGTRDVEIVGAGAASGLALSRLVARQGTCQSSDAELCLLAGRFSVRVAWKDFENRTGGGHVERVSDETGYFWFFNEENVELIVKVLDGRAINGNYWVFYGALSNVEYTITVTDTQTGRVKTYFNPSRNFGSVGDTAAFPGN